ncbi:MAG TPA: DUF4175 family protein, partial [Rhodospirillales bacterium]|nr:DUF4175 family protein [Rhodospirillales bacterium]
MSGPADRPFADTGEQSLGRRYRLLLILAWATVVWERLWRCGWKPVLVFATFAAVVLLDLLPSLPAWAHGMVLLAFKITFVVFLYQAVKNFRGVGWAAARRRLERDSDLAHRPLATLADQPAERGDGLSRQLWLAHMRQLVEQVRDLKLALPSPGLAARDPYGVRAVVLLLLVVGLVVGSGEAGSRLARAYTLGGETGDQFRVEIWLTPPVYSRRSPIFLSNRAESGSVTRLDVPLGTTLNARIAGRSAWYASDPAMEIGDRNVPISPIGGEGDDKKSFSGETILQTQDLGIQR